MITLDRLALAIPPHLIEWRHRERMYNSDNSDLPYHLQISFSTKYNSYKVEFSAKVLGDRYPELINMNNISECLNTINTIGFCSFNVDEVISFARVIGADFTKDIPLTDIPCVNNMNDVKSIIRLSINNYHRWNCENYRSGGIVISNAVNDPRRRRRLTVYDKGYELGLSQNRQFINSLHDANALIEYFKDRVRFELRATTQRQLREWLGVRSLSIMSVLESTANPLRYVMTEMFSPIYAVDESEIRPTLTNCDKLCTLKLLDWDLARVEAHVRESTNRSVREGMKPYERLYRAHNVSESINIVNVVGN